MPLFAILSDRLGRRPIYIGGLVAVATVPFFLLLEQSSVPLVTLALAVSFGIAHRSVYGTQPSFFSELFPARVRYTGSRWACRSRTPFRRPAAGDRHRAGAR